VVNIKNGDFPYSDKALFFYNRRRYLEEYPECLFSTIGISKVREANSQYGIYAEAQHIKG